MKIKEFYESMKTIFQENIIIIKDGEILWEGYINEQRIYEYLMECEIVEIYCIDNGLSLVIK